ncbi:MAG: hypothetical protein AB1551_03930 [Actinomycetota bacterium]
MTLYLRNWRTFMGVAAVAYVPFLLLSLSLGRLFPEEWPMGWGPSLQVSVTTAVMLSLLIVVTALVVEPLAAGAMVKAVAGAYMGERLTVGGAYRYALGAMWSLLLVTLLESLVVITGLVLLIVPGVIFAVRLAFATNALILEGVRGPAALRRSWELSRGSFWWIVGVLLVTGVLAGIAAGVFWLPSYVAGSTIAGPILSEILSSIGQLLTTPFTTAVLVLLYFDMRVRKEGFSLSVPTGEVSHESGGGPA